jgi:hypothetical protein
MRETKFHTHTKQQQNYSSACFKSWHSWTVNWKVKILHRMTARICFIPFHNATVELSDVWVSYSGDAASSSLLGSNDVLLVLKLITYKMWWWNWRKRVVVVEQWFLNRENDRRQQSNDIYIPDESFFKKEPGSRTTAWPGTQWLDYSRNTWSIGMIKGNETDGLAAQMTAVTKTQFSLRAWWEKTWRWSQK